MVAPFPRLAELPLSPHPPLIQVSHLVHSHIIAPAPSRTGVVVWSQALGRGDQRALGGYRLSEDRRSGVRLRLLPAASLTALSRLGAVLARMRMVGPTPLSIPASPIPTAHFANPLLSHSIATPVLGRGSLRRETALASRHHPTPRSERAAFCLAPPASPSRLLIGWGFSSGRHSIICSSGGPGLSSRSNPRPRGNRNPQRNGRQRLRSRSRAPDQGSRRRVTP